MDEKHYLWRLPKPEDRSIGRMRRADDGAWVLGPGAEVAPEVSTTLAYTCGIAIVLASKLLWATDVRAAGNFWPEWACGWLERFVSACAASVVGAKARGAEPHARHLLALCQTRPFSTELPPDVAAAARDLLAAFGIPAPTGGWELLTRENMTADITLAAEQFIDESGASVE